MEERTQRTPIKLKSLREERDIVRSRSNRPRILISPILELPKPLSEEKFKLQNRTPVLTRLKILDSPKSIYETAEESHQILIEKAHAAREVLEPAKDRAKQGTLLYKRDKPDRCLKSGIGYKSALKPYHSPSPEAKIEKTDLNFIEPTPAKKLSKMEAENLISRLQGFTFNKKH